MSAPVNLNAATDPTTNATLAELRTRLLADDALPDCRRQDMASALQYAGYDSTFVVGTEGHNGKHGGAILPEYTRIHPMIGEMLERVASGELRVAIDRSFPLSGAAAAHAYVESRKAFGRVVLTV